MSGARGWREVPVVEIGRGPREYTHIGSSVMWVFEPASLGGISARVDDSGEVAMVVAAFHGLAANLPHPIDFVSDMRHGEDTDPTTVKSAFASYPQVMPALLRVMRRQSGILPRDWAAPYWKALNEHNKAPWPVEVSFEPQDAWAWLGTDAAIVAEVEAFIATMMSAPDPVGTLIAAMRRDPTLEVADAARAAGVSVRTLQRSLAAAGDTFGGLRNRLRLERVEALLSDRTIKLEAIATAVGFASMSHFAAWFRRLRGVTPSQLREGR